MVESALKVWSPIVTVSPTSGSVPSGSVPSGSVPSGSVSSGSVSSGSVPSGSVLRASLLPVTLTLMASGGPVRAGANAFLRRCRPRPRRRRSW